MGEKEASINKLIAEGCDTNAISDGYHTFGELYEHRVTLFIALCRVLARGESNVFVWRSRRHSDGASEPGWFLLGIGREPGAQISYHLAERYWDQTEFAAELDRAPEWDGHSSADVLGRLGKL